MIEIGSIVHVHCKGDYEIQESKSGCKECENRKTPMKEEPCITCVKVCSILERSNIKLSKICGNQDN